MIEHMGSYRFPISGYVDRFYFESLYANIAQGILLEFATDGPGFIDDEEPYETLGERLPCRRNSATIAKKSKAWSANSTPSAARRLSKKNIWTENKKQEPPRINETTPAFFAS